MSRVTLDRPWLEFDLGTDMEVLSWSVNRPGFTIARRIMWREVHNTDLPRGLNVADWLAGELETAKASDAVTMLTSRDVCSFTEASAQAGRCKAHCVATVGLSNAERIGRRRPRTPARWGTINIAVRLSCGLTRTGLIEAMSIATEARTAAVIEVGLTLPTGIATGTGTDCIAIAAPRGPRDFVGLHTDAGEAIGAAAYRATLAGARTWRTAVEPRLKGLIENN